MIFKMYQYTKKIIYNNRFWYFNRWLGITYSSNKKSSGDFETPKEILNPFFVHSRSTKPQKTEISFSARMYVLFLTWAAKHFYPFIYILSHLRLNLYTDAQQASWVFQQITKGKQQKLLCLSRSVFIATTSKRFKEHGTMYIGVFLPSRNMHAWVIEDSLQTDGWDNYWILYQPLIMMRG